MFLLSLSITYMSKKESFMGSHNFYNKHKLKIKHHPTLTSNHNTHKKVNLHKLQANNIYLRYYILQERNYALHVWLLSAKHVKTIILKII